MEESFSDEQRNVLRAMCDAFIPSLGPQDTETIVRADKEFYAKSGAAYEPHRETLVRQWCQRCAADVHTAELVEKTILDHLPTDARWETGLLLTALSTSPGTALLSNGSYWSPFYSLPLKDRQRILLGFSQSFLKDKRKAFNLLKAIIAVTYLRAIPEGGGRNPSWDVLNYHLPLHSETVKNARLFEIHGGKPEFKFTMINRTIMEEIALEVDVVVVGSGCGGGVMAATLSKSNKVLVLEKGEYLSYENMNGTEAQGFDQMYERGATMVTEDTGISVLAGATFGGGTAINWACCLRTPHYVREEWEHAHGLRRYGPSSTSFTRALDAISARIGVKEGNEVAHNVTNRLFLDGCKMCGYDAGTAGQNMKVTRAGAPGAGDISLGDRYGIKNSMPETFLQDAARNGCLFADRCYVSSIVHDGKKASGVVGTIIGKDGRTHHKITVRARKAVIVSCGAINTPALLLRSEVPNRNGLIGKNLRLHPVVGSVATLPRPVRVWEGAPMSTVSNAASGGRDGSHYGVKLECPSVHPAFGGAQLPWSSGVDFKRHLLRLPNAFVTIALCRDKGSGSVVIDKTGTPRIYYPLSQHDRNELTDGAEMLVRISAAVGASTVMSSVIPAKGVVDLPSEENERRKAVDAYVRLIKEHGVSADHRSNVFSAHQMGTARMSARPGTGVTKDTGEMWAMKGVYVADSSLFPTPSGANPQITTLAIVFDMAERLERKLSEESGSKMPSKL